MTAPAVEVWSVDLARAASSLLSIDAAEGLLALADRSKALQLANREAADERLAAGAALRLLIEGVAGVGPRAMPFERGPAGKPMLPGSPCHFSLSHVRGRALVALATDPVGVDLERVRVMRVDGKRRARIEAAAIRAGSGQPLPVDGSERRFPQAWTRLEALAKADGRGIGRLLSEIGVIGVGRRRDLEAAQWLDRDAIGAGHATRDLELGEDFCGAVAAGRGFDLCGPLHELPSDLAGLRGLLTTRRRLVPSVVQGST